jgi:hypothetical protein
MSGTIANREAAQAWRAQHEPHAPKVGAVAPDFELRDPKGNDPVRLSGFRGQAPVALVFGSFT